MFNFRMLYVIVLILFPIATLILIPIVIPIQIQIVIPILIPISIVIQMLILIPRIGIQSRISIGI